MHSISSTYKLSVNWSNSTSFFIPLLLLVLNHSRQCKYIKCQRKNKLAGDYSPIKILAAFIVIDMAEILAAMRANSGACAWICTHTNAHTVLRMVLVSAVAVSLIQTPHPPTKKVWCWLRWGLSTAPLSPCVAMKVYQSSEAPFGSQRAKLCYRGSCVYICILRQCDISK